MYKHTRSPLLVSYRGWDTVLRPKSPRMLNICFRRCEGHKVQNEDMALLYGTDTKYLCVVAQVY